MEMKLKFQVRGTMTDIAAVRMGVRSCSNLTADNIVAQFTV